MSNMVIVQLEEIDERENCTVVKGIFADGHTCVAVFNNPDPLLKSVLDASINEHLVMIDQSTASTINPGDEDGMDALLINPMVTAVSHATS